MLINLGSLYSRFLLLFNTIVLVTFMIKNSFKGGMTAGSGCAARARRGHPRCRARWNLPSTLPFCQAYRGHPWQTYIDGNGGIGEVTETIQYACLFVHKELKNKISVKIIIPPIKLG